MNLNKVFQPKKEDVIENWIVLDASNKTLGRFATEVADILRGKNTLCFTPYVKTGSRVVIINAEKISMTGKKSSDKDYWHYTGWIGNKKKYKAKDLYSKDPAHIIYHAVKGMMRKCKMDRQIIEDNLKVYVGPSHPHQAQIK